MARIDGIYDALGRPIFRVPDSWITATGAANAAVTATLPAAGVGLFHYVQGIWIMRAGAAALTGTAALVITSTNLLGNPAWSVGNAMAAGGTQRDVELDLAGAPLKAIAANTASTIVCPVPGAGVLWRINVAYAIDT